ncbi:MAG: dynamin family protein [Planctomycetaceae bacterium]
MDERTDSLRALLTWRVLLVAALWLVPVVATAVLGLYALWKLRLFWWTWWLGPLCWLLAWWLTQRWQPDLGPAAGAISPEPLWATPRDQAGQAVIADFQQRVAGRTTAELLDLNQVRKDVEELALALARHYHPAADNPLDPVTVPELLAVIRLAIDDLEAWLPQTIPGSRLLTIGRWKQLRNAPEWFARLRDLSWAASILWNPANLARLLVSRWTGTHVTSALQTELVATAYLRFLDRVGFYLKELNSGRLRGGAEIYRATFDLPGTQPPASAPRLTEPKSVTITLIGQASSGKSSLINALVGEQVARVDVLPATQEVARHRVMFSEAETQVTLLDTPGYGAVETTTSQTRQIETAMCEADVVLLVMDAHVPAREADLRQLRWLRNWFASQPNRRPPAVVGVLTHVDLLPPSLVWQVPCAWREPVTAKDRVVAAAVHEVQTLLGEGVAEVVPVCSQNDPRRQWGICEELAPLLTLLLPDAQATCLLRLFEKEQTGNWWTDLRRQTCGLGSELWNLWLERRLK